MDTRCPVCKRAVIKHDESDELTTMVTTEDADGRWVYWHMACYEQALESDE